MSERMHYSALASANAGPGIIAVSALMGAVVRQAWEYAATTYPIVLLGPTGVGKGLIARAIHASSRVANEAFVTLSGGELTAGLLHNQLFGHVRGAFTGALSSAKGAFEQAARGTFFLDELHHWIPEVQSALLRVLGDGEVKPIFAARAIPLTCRLIFAANKPLDELVAEGKLLPDLRYRIGDFEIAVPALADRRADIVPLAYHFLERVKAQNDLTPQMVIAPQALWQLLRYDWPGNVRELEGVITRSAIHARGEIAIQVQNLPARLQDPRVNFDAMDGEVRHQLIGWAYAYTHESRRDAASLLGVHPNTIDYHRRQWRSAKSDESVPQAG
jgi:DNA-binding NtrC family response regulator